MYPVIKRGPRVSLRELTAVDVDALTAVYGDPVTTEQLSFEPRSREQVAALITRSMVSAVTQPRVEYMLAIALNDTDELIGAMRLAYGEITAAPPSATGAVGDTAQFGCAVSAAQWGHGYGHEATVLVLELAFEDLGIEQVWGARGPENGASATLMRRLGFSDITRFPDHITKAGKPRDSIVAVAARPERL